MPQYVVSRVCDALNQKGKSVKGSKILILGLAYKKDVEDVRESPSFELIELLRAKGAYVNYNDPYIPKTKKMRHYDLRMCSTPLTEKNIKRFDCVVIATDHSSYDYNFIAKHSKLIIDTRNAMKKVCGMKRGKVIKA